VLCCVHPRRVGCLGDCRHGVVRAREPMLCSGRLDNGPCEPRVCECDKCDWGCIRSPTRICRYAMSYAICQKQYVCVYVIRIRALLLLLMLISRFPPSTCLTNVSVSVSVFVCHAMPCQVGCEVMRVCCGVGVADCWRFRYSNTWSVKWRHVDCLIA
jgi:hypothetical protein